MNDEQWPKRPNMMKCNGVLSDTQRQANQHEVPALSDKFGSLSPSSGMPSHIVTQHAVHTSLPAIASRLEKLDDLGTVPH
jgi:hypothetical protein